jgi:hypothetical protein
VPLRCVSPCMFPLEDGQGRQFGILYQTPRSHEAIEVIIINLAKVVNVLKHKDGYNCGLFLAWNARWAIAKLANNLH